jgi:AhpD family alkylhydroperoxidase
MKTILMALAIGTCLAMTGASAQTPGDENEGVYAEIEQVFGTVPSFLREYPRVAIAGAWDAMKALQLNPETALSPKEKELIGLAVAAQIPCAYCVYFHTAAAEAAGATEEEIREAIAMAGMIRHWSTVVNGLHIDFAEFQAEADAIMQHVQASE